MRPLSLLFIAGLALAQQPPFTLDQVLGFAFPSELTAAPGGGKIAWTANLRGVRNVMVAEAPGYQPRQLTSYTEDDGQDLSQLVWTSDAGAILYTRGEGVNRAGEYANPALNPQGVEQDVWMIALTGGPPRKIGPGSSPSVSPKGGQVVFIRRSRLWLASLDKETPAAPLFEGRGDCVSPVWSPDGTHIAFESHRGDHSFIGVFDLAGHTLRYLDPGTDSDLYPEWSPEGRRVAFVRIPSTGLRTVREARRSGEPWSIRVTAVDTGRGHAIWRAGEGAGSVFREITARNQLLWVGTRIVFPWEAGGWLHLFSVPATGGAAVLLTRGAFEVEQAVIDPGSTEVIFNSNQDDIDRRHLWRVPISGSTAPVPITSGQGIEWSPTPAGGNALAYLCSDAHLPAHVAIRIGGESRDIGSLPGDFPVSRMVTPQPVIFQAADGLSIHGQLFLPPGRAAGTRSPAVVFFHGGPQRQMLLGWHYRSYYSNAYALNQYLANAGYVVLAINFRSGIGYGLDFREALHFGASGASEMADVEAAGRFLESRPDVDPRRIGAWGGSYGGYLTAMALARTPDMYHAGVDFAGVHDWAIELGIPAGAPDYKVAFDSSPLSTLDRWRAPVLLIQGDDDRDVLFKNTVILADALRRRKVEVELLIFPDEDHEFLLYRSWRQAYQATVDFLGRKLPLR